MKCKKCEGILEIIKMVRKKDKTIYTLKCSDCGDVTTMEEYK